MKSLKRFYQKLEKNIIRYGLRGIGTTIAESAFYLEREIRSQWNAARASNIYEQDWDVLILLDCATIDMMNEIQDKYGFLHDSNQLISVGTTSPEWMENTFTSEYSDQMNETIHITANTSSEQKLNESNFQILDEVWREGWDEKLGTIPARAVTDRAIYYLRRYDPEFVILHYMQPHPPFVRQLDIEASNVTRQMQKSDGMNLQELHYESGYSRQELWDAHIENLKYVLDDIKLLLENISAERVVISADHGQAFGEKGVWDHPAGAGVNEVRYVPWYVTSASDCGAYDPELKPEDKESEYNIDIKKKLRHLGYK